MMKENRVGLTKKLKGYKGYSHDKRIRGFLSEIAKEKRDRSTGRLKDDPRIWPCDIELDPEENWWIRFVNEMEDVYPPYRLDTLSVSETRPAIDNILFLLNQYVEAREKKEGERWAEFDRIALEVTERMKGADRVLVRHTLLPGVLGPTLKSGFHFGPAQGTVSPIYASLASFLQGPNARRLGKCLYCDGLFIGPDDRKRKYCPDTDHKNLYWQNVRYVKKDKQQSS